MDRFAGESVLGSAAKADEVAMPLVCDLDGTIVKTDLIWQSVIVLLKKSPFKILLVIGWLLRGRPYLKHRLIEAAPLDPECLGYRVDVLDVVKDAKANGRQVFLATAADQGIAEEVAEHLGVFEGVYATSAKVNLKGSAKAELLEKEFGPKAFDYIGDSMADMPVWAACRHAYVVGTESFARKVARVAEVAKVFPTKPASPRTWFRALRGHHWAKNALLFVPLLLAHQLHPKQVFEALLGFVLFGVVASSVYIFNDVADLHSDRAHPWKANRPIASGEISIGSGLVVACLLIVLGLIGSIVLLPAFGLVLTGYVVLTMWYSAHLKKVVLLDTFVLAAFYTVRVWAGGLITAVSLSQWLLAFSMFFFLSLAVAKRYSELLHATDLVERNRSGRGYRTTDRELLGVLGVSSSFSAIIILALYIQSPQVVALYRRPESLLLLCPILLYWLSRLWLQAYRGELHEDPVTLALKDKVSYVVALLVVAIGALAA